MPNPRPMGVETSNMGLAIRMGGECKARLLCITDTGRARKNHNSWALQVSRKPLIVGRFLFFEAVRPAALGLRRIEPRAQGSEARPQLVELLLLAVHDVTQLCVRAFQE